MEAESLDTLKEKITANIDATISALKENREILKGAKNHKRLEFYLILSGHDLGTVKNERVLMR